MTDFPQALDGAFVASQAGSNRLIEESLTTIQKALTGLRFGSVLLTVHDGRVVQIDVTEKRRLRPD